VFREPRDDDPSRTQYFELDDADLQLQFDRIRKRKLVQYIVHPTLNMLYGSEIWDYPKLYNLKDVIPEAVARLDRAGFARTVNFGIVTPPETWVPRLNKRYPQGHEQHLPRLEEGSNNLKWILSQPKNGIHLISNDGEPEYAAQRLIDILHMRTDGSDEAAREIGQRQLACIDAMLEAV
jgi:hypothetical protein